MMLFILLPRKVEDLIGWNVMMRTARMWIVVFWMNLEDLTSIRNGRDGRSWKLHSSRHQIKSEKLSAEISEAKREREYEQAGRSSLSNELVSKVKIKNMMTTEVEWSDKRWRWVKRKQILHWGNLGEGCCQYNLSKNGLGCSSIFCCSSKAYWKAERQSDRQLQSQREGIRKGQ